MKGLRYAAIRMLRTQPELSHEKKDLAMSHVVDSFEMILGDNRSKDKHFLKCYVIQNGPVEIQYLYDSHAKNTDGLLRRFADVLAYDIHTD